MWGRSANHCHVHPTSTPMKTKYQIVTCWLCLLHTDVEFSVQKYYCAVIVLLSLVGDLNKTKMTYKLKCEENQTPHPRRPVTIQKGGLHSDAGQFIHSLCFTKTLGNAQTGFVRRSEQMLLVLQDLWNIGSMSEVWKVSRWWFVSFKTAVIVWVWVISAKKMIFLHHLTVLKFDLAYVHTLELVKNNIHKRSTLLCNFYCKSYLVKSAVPSWPCRNSGQVHSIYRGIYSGAAYTCSQTPKGPQSQRDLWQR